MRNLTVKTSFALWKTLLRYAEKMSHRLGEYICKSISDKGLYPEYIKNSQNSTKEKAT